MSAPFGPYALTLDGITKQMRRTFETFIDPRKGKNKSYTMVDAALSAFSVFFTQSPSFLEYQRSLEQTQGNNNARTLFGVHEIPSDNQIRSLLDATPPTTLKPVYAFLFDALEQAGVVDSFRSVGGTLLVAFDGTEYFSSQAIHCECCSTRHRRTRSSRCMPSCSMPWSRPGWWIPSARWAARCCWPSTARSISPRKPSIASAARRGGTPTARPPISTPP